MVDGIYVDGLSSESELFVSCLWGSFCVPGSDLLGHIQHTLNCEPHGILKFLVDTVTSKKKGKFRIYLIEFSVD